MIGIYGIVAYSVRQRQCEMGIRMALGASSADVMSLVLGKGARLCIIGVLIGVPIAVAVSSFLNSLLLGISPHDLTVFMTVPTVLVFASLLASYFPARRAAKVDPITVVRSQ